MQLSIARNYDAETPQQREAHRQARRIQYDVQLVASALTQADNGRSDRNPESEKVELSDAYVRHHESFGYNHFSKLTGSMSKAEGQLQKLEARGVHQYEWLELSPPACQPYQMGSFDVAFRREGNEEVYRSGEMSLRINPSLGTLTLTD
ncbi:hypothetical protein JST97_15935 [bacterium]|nr:hypothetical protein [bacterium]